MRPLSALPLLLVALAFAGCLSDPETTPAEAELGSDVTPAGTPPQDIVFTGSLVGEGDVSSNAPCALGQRQCTVHVVTVPPGNWNVTFTLVGTDGTVTSAGTPYFTDYDLFVDGVGESTNPGGEEDVIEAGRLDPGEYEAQVVAWHDIDGSYTLTVSFSA